MKLLLDQNISYKLVEKLSTLFPESNHVRFLESHTASDKDIWEYAKNNDYLLVTQDMDFFEMSLVYGFPLKIIWLRTGNTRTKIIQNIIVNHFRAIRDFYEDRTAACLELF